MFSDTVVGQFFAEVAEREITRARRHTHPLTLVFLDIDKFKEVNDTYGHQAGDDLLKKIAGAITESCRKSDLAARWGRDEFIISLSRADVYCFQYYPSREMGPSYVGKGDTYRFVCAGLGPVNHLGWDYPSPHSAR